MTAETLTRDALRSVDSTTFDTTVLDAPGPVAVEFMSYSCAHCRAIEEVLQRAAQALAPHQAVYRVNVMQEPALADRFGVQGTPTLVMFLHGAELSRVTGPRPELDSLIDALTAPFKGRA